MKKRVLQVLPSLNVGGVERGVVDLSRLSLNSHYKFIVASNGGKMLPELQKLGIKHIEFNLKSKNPINIIKNIFILAKICDRLKIDILHCRSRSVAWSGYFAYKLLKRKIKFVTTFHGIYSFNFPLKKFYNGIMLKGQRVIAVSNFVKNHMLQNYRVDEKKIVVVNRGVDEHYFSPAKARVSKEYKGKKLIFVPARISRWKGQELLIEALSSISDENFLCLMVGSVGESAFGKELQDKINQHGLQEKIKIIESQSDIRPLYKASSFVVIPSLRPEAFGRIAIEAGSMGKFVIAFNYGGVAETILDGKTGSLVAPHNKQELSQKIKEALNFDEQKLSQIALQARNHIVANYRLQKMFDETIKVYDSLIK
jgi:glycosyltransferase involved in cell wall biosynthesis